MKDDLTPETEGIKMAVKPRVGAQLFINRHDTPQKVADQLAKMAQANFTLVRVFLAWDHLEPRHKIWRWEVYDQVFISAEENGLKVIATLMAVSPPGWMRISQGLQDVGNLDDSIFWQKALDYTSKVVNRWKDEPSLDSWILWNEPARTLNKSPRVMGEFQKFLRRKYQESIQELNKLYHRQYACFEEIGDQICSESYALGFGSHVESVDWIEFSVDHLMAKLRELAILVRSLDSNHLLHLNPHRMSQSLLECGQSIWREAELVDFMGFSAHPAWHSTRFPEDRIQQSIGMFADLARSATKDPDGRFLCTELQGGPTLFSAFRPSAPSGSEVARWMWECFGSGAEAVVFWCFNSRDDGYEAGEWSLCHHDGTPSERLVEASGVAEAVKQYWIPEARARPELVILCSESSQLMGLVEGEGELVTNPRNRQMGADAVCGAYLMAADLGYEIGFIDERRLCSSGVPDSAKILVAAGCCAVSEESIKIITRWVKQGGCFLADSLFGWKTSTGALARHLQPLIRNLLGSDVLDYAALSNQSFELEDGKYGTGWFVRAKLALRPHTRVLGRWKDGTEAVTDFKLGLGHSIRLGTVFFQHYLPYPSGTNLEIFKSLVFRHAQPLIRLQCPALGLRLRRRETAEAIFCVIIGSPGMDSVGVFFEQKGCLEMSGQPLRQVPEKQTCEIELDCNNTACFTFHRERAFPNSTRAPLPAEKAALGPLEIVCKF